MSAYADFLATKALIVQPSGLDVESGVIHPSLFPFQRVAATRSTPSRHGIIGARKVPRRCANTPGPTPGVSLMRVNPTMPSGMPSRRPGRPRGTDLSGQRFGRLTVLDKANDRMKNGAVRWICRCDCGKSATVSGQSLRNGVSTSCGCFHREALTARNLTHGKTRSRVYRAWANMIQRCRNPKSSHWREYGERGISICERWQCFANFYADMGDPPNGTTLDRIDVNGNYEPLNCRWVTQSMQVGNRRNSITIVVDGRSVLLSEWARKSGTPYTTAYARYRTGAL